MKYLNNCYSNPAIQARALTRAVRHDARWQNVFFTPVKAKGCDLKRESDAIELFVERYRDNLTLRQLARNHGKSVENVRLRSNWGRRLLVNAWHNGAR